MKDIDWNHWLKRRTLLEIEMALLTLGLNPDNFQIDCFGGHYLQNRSDLQALEKEYDKRMDLIRDYRFSRYEYMSEDGESGNYYFNIEGSLKVKRFLLWLKHEDMGWELPPELKTHIDFMAKSKNLKNIETNEKRLPPTEWHPYCDKYAEEALIKNIELSQKDVAIRILDNFQKEGILSLKGKPLAISSITRRLSDWKFTIKRITIKNNKNS